MPVLDIIAKDGRARWDAMGRVEAALYFPQDPDLRAGYEACWRAEHKVVLPENQRLFWRTTHDPAKAFAGEEKIRGRLAHRRKEIERIGTAFWLQAVLSQIDPTNASEDKAIYAIGEIAHLSRSTLKRDWAEYRGVIHWCAAVSYQRRVFTAPLLHYPQLGPSSYSMEAAFFDFLVLGHQFFAFARDSGCFTPTPSFKPERDLWTFPKAVRKLAPRREDSWPDCDRIRGILPAEAVLAKLIEYDATLLRA